MGLAADVKRVYRERGTGGVVCRSARRLFRAVADTNSAHWLYRRCDDTLPLIAAPGIFEAVFDKPEETLEWLQHSGEPWMRVKTELAVARRQRHILGHVKQDGRIIGYIKVAVGKVYIHDYRACFSIPRKAAFIYDTFILTPYRGRGVARWFIAQALLYMRASGIVVVGCHIPPWNAASLAAYAGCGFRAREYVRMFRIAGLKMFFVRGERRLRGWFNALEEFYSS